MDRKYNSESRNVRWSTIVLSVSLLLVYIVLFYVKGDDLKAFNTYTSTSLNTGLILSEVDIGENVNNPILYSNEGHEDNQEGFISNTIVDKGVSENGVGLVVGEINLGQGGIDSHVINNGSMDLLPGTKTYYGDLDFVNLLGISYKYALRDDKGIYYLNMDGYTYDFSDIARKLGGNLYIMNTESEILANKMFGNKVTYINIPEYANRKVLMLIDVNNQSRLLAVDYSIYHQVKSYLKFLFIY